MNQSEIDALVALDPTLYAFEGELYRLAERTTPACENCAIGIDAVTLRCGTRKKVEDRAVCSKHAERLQLSFMLARYEPVRD